VDRGVVGFGLADGDVAAVRVVVSDVDGVAVRVALANRHLLSFRLVYAHVDVIVVLG